MCLDGGDACVEVETILAHHSVGLPDRRQSIGPSHQRAPCEMVEEGVGGWGRQGNDIRHAELQVYGGELVAREVNGVRGMLLRSILLRCQACDFDELSE